MSYLRQAKHTDDSAIRQDLSVGLHTVAEINQTIRFADTKAGALAAVQALTVSVLIGKRDMTDGHWLTVLAVQVWIAAILLSACLLAAGQAARLVEDGTLPGIRAAFPSLSALPAHRALKA